MQRAIKRYLLDLIRLSVCANTQCRSDWIKIDGIDLRLPFHQEILLVISLVIDKGFFETANLRILLSLRNWKKFSGNLYSILGFRLRFCDVRSRFSIGRRWSSWKSRLRLCRSHGDCADGWILRLIGWDPLAIEGRLMASNTYVLDRSSASEMTGSPSTSSPLLEGRNSCLRMVGRPLISSNKTKHVSIMADRNHQVNITWINFDSYQFDFVIYSSLKLAWHYSPNDSSSRINSVEFRWGETNKYKRDWSNLSDWECRGLISMWQGMEEENVGLATFVPLPQLLEFLLHQILLRLGRGGCSGRFFLVNFFVHFLIQASTKHINESKSSN